MSEALEDLREEAVESVEGDVESVCELIDDLMDPANMSLSRAQVFLEELRGRVGVKLGGVLDDVKKAQQL